MSNLNIFEPDYIVPPGETINELLEHYNMTQKELSRRIDLAQKTVNEIVKGKAPITYETASKLENVFGIEASFWNNLEKNYREQLAEKDKREQLESQIGELKKFPIRELIKNKWITLDKGTAEEKVDKLLKFFGVSSFHTLGKLLDDNKIIEGAFRISPNHNINEESLMCWIRKGEIEASKIATDSFSKSKALESLDELRRLTLEIDPDIFIPKMQQICSTFGVALVFIPEIKGSRVSGLTRWLTPKPKAIIQLSLRYKVHDSLWFTFFHELGHVILHEKKPFIEFGKYKEDPREREADEFSSELLIPEEELTALIEKGISRENIKGFANEIGIHPGILVGRLQTLKIIPWNQYQDLKVRYQWNEDEG